MAFKENIPIENLFVISDDLNLDFGSIRIRSNGTAGGHNGLKDIQENLMTNDYARLRIGIGNNFQKENKYTMYWVNGLQKK